MYAPKLTAILLVSASTINSRLATTPQRSSSRFKPSVKLDRRDQTDDHHDNKHDTQHCQSQADLSVSRAASLDIRRQAFGVSARMEPATCQASSARAWGATVPVQRTAPKPLGPARPSRTAPSSVPSRYQVLCSRTCSPSSLLMWFRQHENTFSGDQLLSHGCSGVTYSKRPTPP